jgi:hypothetical protein
MDSKGFLVLPARCETVCAVLLGLIGGDQLQQHYLKEGN